MVADVGQVACAGDGGPAGAGTLNGLFDVVFGEESVSLLLDGRETRD
jgi:hypothetical protein